MIIDFHIHERTFSEDSHMNLLEIVEEAKKKGIEGLCITDHDQIGLTDYAKKVSEKFNIPIFVGVEYLSIEGDILAFGIEELPNPHLSAQEFIDYVNSKGGVCIAAHPFRSNSRGLGENLLTLKGLIGIEVLNGSTSNSSNKLAYEYCMKLSLQPIGASDAHNLVNLGRYATELPGTYNTVPELIHGLKTQKCKPLILSGYKEFEF